MPVDERRFPDIPRRRGPGAIGWIFFIIVVAFVVWLVAGGFGNRHVQAARQSATTSATTPSAPDNRRAGGNATVSDLQKLAHSSDPQDLVNQQVKLDKVKVLQVTSQNDFWAGTDADNRVFVVQRHEAKLPDANNTNLAVKAGDTVSLTGMVQQPDAGIEQARDWGLTSDADVQQLHREGVYILANEVHRQK